MSPGVQRAEEAIDAIAARPSGRVLTMSRAYAQPTGVTLAPGAVEPVWKLNRMSVGLSLLVQPAAFVLSRSTGRSAPERVAVLKAAADGDLSSAMDAMLAWAIAEQRYGGRQRMSLAPDEVRAE